MVESFTRLQSPAHGQAPSSAGAPRTLSVPLASLSRLRRTLAKVRARHCRVRSRIGRTVEAFTLTVVPVYPSVQRLSAGRFQGPLGRPNLTGGLTVQFESVNTCRVVTTLPRVKYAVSPRWVLSVQEVVICSPSSPGRVATAPAAMTINSPGRGFMVTGLLSSFG